jgi:hypothetical protein
VSSSMKNSTYSRRSQTVSTVKKGSVALRDRKACRHSALPYPALQHER